MSYFQAYNPTDAQQVAANRGGLITPEQKAAMKWHADVRWGSLITPVVILSIAFIVVMLAVWYSARSTLPIWGYAIIVAFFGFGFVVAIVPQAWKLVGALRTRADLESGQVEALDGQVTWRRNGYAAEASGRRLRLPLGMTGLHPGSYRFYFLSNTGWLLSAERYPPPGGEDLNAELRSVLSRVFGVSDEALEANRQGRLTLWQMLKLLFTLASTSFISLLVAAIFGAIGWSMWSNVRDANLRWVILIAGGLALMVLLIYLLVKAVQTGLDLLRGQAARAEGFVHKTYTVTYSRYGSSTTYYFEIEKLRFRVARGPYNALIDNLPYRLYYAPLSKKLMAVEPAPSR